MIHEALEVEFIVPFGWQGLCSCGWFVLGMPNAIVSISGGSYNHTNQTDAKELVELWLELHVDNQNKKELHASTTSK